MVSPAGIHPLEPLTADEIAQAVNLVRSLAPLPARHRFIQVVLSEPPKDAVLGWRPDQPIDRQALVVVLDNLTGTTTETVVSLSNAALISKRERTGVQPPISLDEFDECEQACKAHPEFQEALLKRGIEDFDSVIIDPWSAGAYEDNQGRRLARGLTWVRMGEMDNAYAHPVENLVAIVDLNSMEVVRIEDSGVVPVPMTAGNFSQSDVVSIRSDLKVLEIAQPDGVSFSVSGHHICWQKWSVRIGFTPREGLVLHQLSYEDQGISRPILYRASLSEMVVPYGDPMPVHTRKNAFDAGEYNVGALANALELGCDCLGSIHYFDAVLADSRGNPLTLPNAICLHEEDYGILWKHFDFRTGQTEVRRSRRLVISWISTVANYEYGFYWYLYQDGTIELEVKLTGVLSTGALPSGEKSAYGQVLTADGLYAPIHQHFMNFRLDLDVDGRENSIYEVHLEQAPADAIRNPENSAFFAQGTLISRESEGQQLVDPAHGRFWRIINPNVTNAVGDPVGFRLMPKGTATLMARQDASVSRRAAFATRNVWVTAFDESERHAAGNYPNQHPGGAGLPEWSSADRALENADLVLWYTLGTQHVPRLEDWPVMPVVYAGFMLQPEGFFDRNPALDVPAQIGPHGQHGAHCHIPE